MRKKILSFFFSFILGCSVLALPSYASTKVYVKSTVNVRSHASNSSEILGVISRGSQIEKISESRGWTKIEYKGEEAYVASSFLTDIASSTESEATTASTQSTESVGEATTSTATTSKNGVLVYVNHSSVNVREKASSKSTLLGTAKRGAAFYRVESKNGWTKIEYGSGYAYIASQYLSGTKPSGSTTASSTSTSSTSTASTKSTGVVYVTNRYVNVRAKASSKSTLLGRAYKGEKLYKLGTSGVFTKIRYGSSVGYVATVYISSASSSSTTATGTAKGSTAYVTNRYVNVRAKASSKSTLLGKLYKGAKVTVVGESGSFTKIKYNSGYAYVATKYLSA